MTTDASNAHLTWLEAGSATADPVPAEVAALTQWLDPRLSDQVAASSGPAAHLPLIEQPVAGARRAVIFISGDGGWAQLDRTVSAQLNAAGIAVVGWDALSYFWRARQPQDIADDLARIMVVYRSRWGIERFTVVGYSFGANVLPFALNRLPAAAAAAIDKVVLLGPSANTSFEFHLRDWLGHGPVETTAVTPEISALKRVPVVCVRGRDDDDARCPSLTPPSRTVTVAGDHHFAADYAGLAALIAAPLSAAR